MRSKRVLLVVLVCFLLVSGVGFVFANTLNKSYENGFVNQVAYAGCWNWGPTVNSSAGFALTGNGEFLSYVNVLMYNTTLSQGSGSLRAYLYNSSGGSPASKLEGSVNVQDVSQLAVASSAANGQELRFYFSNNTQLGNGVDYFIFVEIYSTLANQIRIGVAAAGTIWYRIGTGAFSNAANQPVYQVYTYTFAGGSGSGSGSGSTDNSGSWLSNVDFSGAVSWLAVLLLFLVPPFILGVYMRGGKWGFLIGLAIGTGLSYFVFPLLVPIWLVILVAIGLGAAFLTSVKEGG